MSRQGWLSRPRAHSPSGRGLRADGVAPFAGTPARARRPVAAGGPAGSGRPSPPPGMACPVG